MLTMVVPIYNMEQYLPRCMEGFLAQTCREFEVLLVDDGSTDGSGALCDAYAVEYPDLIRVVHKNNGGLSSARNTGIDAAKGTFVVFPDPDDWVEDDYVEKFLKYQGEHSADLVCTGYYVDSEDGCFPAKQDHVPILMDGTAGQGALLLPPQMDGFAWNKLYRLDIIRENNLRFLDDVGTTEDLDFAYRYLACCQNICFAPAARTYHYFQRDGAATRGGFSKKKMDSLRTYEKIIADCETAMPDLARAARDEICTTAVNLIWMYGNTEQKDSGVKKILLRHIRKNLVAYLFGKRYGTGRKIQAVLAASCPSLYVRLKNAVQR